LSVKGISAEKWELDALTRGAKITFGTQIVHYKTVKDWAEFY